MTNKPQESTGVPNKHSTKRHTYEYIKEQFELQGCKLLSEVYINSSTHLEYQCSCGNISTIAYSDFSQGKRCKACGIKRRSKTITTSFEKIKEIFEKRGYTLISTEYDPKGKLQSLCPRGHEYFTRLGSFKYGYGCKLCADINNSGPNNHHWNPDRNQVLLNKTFWNRWRNLLRTGIAISKKQQTQRIYDMLGYSWQELEAHIKNHPNWKLIDLSNFHLDHIFPVAAFHKYGIYDPKIVCALDNLQPISAKENRRKWDSYDEEEFKAYLISKGIVI